MTKTKPAQRTEPIESPDVADVVADGSMTLREATQFSGLPRSSLYLLMSSGKLAFTKIGKRRLIPRNAMRKLIADGLVGVK